MSNEEKESVKESVAGSAVNAGTGIVLEASRREKLRKIEELGFDPWGQRFDDHLAIQNIRDRENEIIVIEPAQAEIDEAAANKRRPPQSRSTGPKVRAAGRIILQRKKGKLIFLDIWDWSGKIQVLIGASQVGEQKWELAQLFDLGDIIGVDGELMKTHTGELSIAATDITFLSKSIETPPDKFHGITDPELRSRLRYLDLIHTDGVLERMLKRTKIVHSVRQTLAGEGFVEVEGPTLHPIAGGAAAKPFATHHNALDIPLVLRIALELHLKRLLVGGMERVYELGRVYRNEGIDQRHNPEFTMLEVYQAYGNYETMMDLTEKIIVNAVKAINSTSAAAKFTPPFARKKYDDLIKEYTGIEPADAAAVAQYAKSVGLDIEGKHPDIIKNEMFEEKVEKNLIEPTFVYDYPANICPLTKRKHSNPNIAERFELFVNGMELANAYTELNDPDLQEQLFSRQLAGQKEEDSMAKMDKDFIRALRHAMPPAGGLGIGIDRLCMLLTETSSIREVILFPLQRPEN
ncbi:lysine--tRNA ligase [Planctomycetales bacterium]|nr:lysine--tRNA ligase [Planctomycetales bacterium]GHT35234.1 lysine--tRNA ligase [Planctomycetales bacterium]